MRLLLPSSRSLCTLFALGATACIPDRAHFDASDAAVEGSPSGADDASFELDGGTLREPDASPSSSLTADASAPSQRPSTTAQPDAETLPGAAATDAGTTDAAGVTEAGVSVAPPARDAGLVLDLAGAQPACTTDLNFPNRPDWFRIVNVEKNVPVWVDPPATSSRELLVGNTASGGDKLSFCRDTKRTDWPSDHFAIFSNAHWQYWSVKQSAGGWRVGEFAASIGSAQELFEFERVGVRSYTIRSAASGLYLTASGGEVVLTESPTLLSHFRIEPDTLDLYFPP